MKIRKLIMGQSLTHRFLYVQTSFLPFPITHCSPLVYVSVRNVCRSNPNKTRIYGKWPRGSRDSHRLAKGNSLQRRWFLEPLPVRLLFICYSESDTDRINNSGCLNTRDTLLKIIRRNIWILHLLRLVNIMTPEMWEISRSPSIAFWYIVLRPALTQIFQQTGTIFSLLLCQ